MAPIYNETVKTVQTNKKITLKVINSLLGGCEFELDHECTFFHVSSPKQLTEYPVDNSNALIIPINEGGINFEVIIKDNLVDEVELVKHNADGLIKSTVKFNDEIYIGSLIIIMKLAINSWAPNNSQLNATKAFKRTSSPKKRLAAIYTFLTALLLTFAYFKIYSKGAGSNLIPVAHSALSNKNILKPLNKPLNKSLPNIKVAKKDSNDIQEVENALRKMKLSFTKDKINKLTNFNFVGEIDDETIQKIKFLKQKYPNPDYFLSINLKDTPPANKSFKYGKQGYIKLSANHWLLNRST
ncbi:PrgH/EprH family type III secretion apparatus protein [Rouxiella sp. T17]|uniref:PrgH/EprH family type III secretion apparatus protein n=1 Tax=Rouxiella sp. T17 TaxID=3085684 RepID=UPI002FCC7FA4